MAKKLSPEARTARDVMAEIEKQYGKKNLTWWMSKLIRDTRQAIKEGKRIEKADISALLQQAEADKRWLPQ